MHYYIVIKLMYYFKSWCLRTLMHILVYAICGAGIINFAVSIHLITDDSSFLVV